MKKFRFFEDEGNTIMFIVYPFNDKNTTFGFNVQKNELYQLYIDLQEYFSNNTQKGTEDK